MRCLSADQFLWQHNLHTAQALVLLIYAISHAHGPAFALLGTAFHILVSIGCHIDPIQLNLGPVESEQRRRCWAAMMMLYTIQNTCLGNIAPMDITATVRPPADVNDEDIALGVSAQYYAGDSEPRPPTKMSYVLFKFKLYQLAADICQFARSNTNLNRMLELDRWISREEEEHNSRFNSTQSLPVYHLANQGILKNYTNHLRLILHRPYLQAHPTRLELKEQVLKSRKKCKDAAMTILANHEYLYEVGHFKPYRWFVYGIGSFHAFLAASTLIVLLGSQSADEASDNAHVADVLRRCQSRLEQMAARSDVCSKGAHILGRLLYAPLGGNSMKISPASRQGTSLHGSEFVSDSRDAAQYSGANGADSEFTQPGFPCESEPTQLHAPTSSFFFCPPQLHDLVQLPPEQWLGGPSGLAWKWSAWADPASSPEMSFSGSEAFLSNTNTMI